ncbi:MAG: S41 family peptidase [Nitrospirae bacterium]|nr:S41 family peptidase [Nitrospirota bacterium]
MFKRKSIVPWALVLLVVITGIIISQWSLAWVNVEGSHYENLKTFAEVLSLIKKNYVEEVEDKELVHGAIKGMLNSLDPHSSFMPPDAYKEMQIETKGEFGGLGIQIGLKDDALTVIAPIEDTPAYKAGVKAGDRIVKINGESTKDMSLQDAVSKLRGPKGTSVTITLMRKDWSEPKDITLIRDIIRIRSVKTKVLEDKIGYIKLTQFQEQTVSELDTALKELVEKENITSLILDLRNNPGGLLESSVNVSSRFLPRGKLVVYTKGRKEDKKEYLTSNNTPHYEFPMAVLVNEGSASASEIVAGALKDWSKAVIIGTTTFGKGSVQTVIPLSDGSALRLTIARYYTPKGTSIQNTGITPDIIVKPKLKKGVKGHPILREKDLEKHLGNDMIKEKEQDMEKEQDKEMLEAPPFADVSEEEDIQLQRAIDVLKTWKILKAMPAAS